MSDLRLAKDKLKKHTLVLCKNGAIITSDRRGVAPMLNFISEGRDLKGYSAADRVVGKAVALLFCKAGVKSVYARTLSKSGKVVLDRAGIYTEYDMLAECIINREGTDMCPMEKAVMDIEDAESAYAAVKKRFDLLTSGS